MISPRQQQENVIKHVNGVISVDGKEYPMAEELVATENIIQHRIKAVAKQLTDFYRPLLHRDTHSSKGLAPISDENPLIIISVLKGSYIFTADMVRYLGDYGLPHVVDFLRVSSYSGTKCTNAMQLLADIRFKDLRGKHVLLLEDISDSGNTLRYIIDKIQQEHHPASLKVCVLADKPAGRRVQVHPDFVCLTVPNKYVIGYGFEVNDRYRCFRHIFTLKPEEATRYPSQL
ncbi:hypoxanthine-guanine phosphoribosyltransferase [Trypanosoma rangeli]|uniref:Hypoxanthine-guanine phosphoribosyltransferase n=1 Tax=Trypanosoma rangeli TaxID=5698 RepID=A0A422N3N7_TRYRA|nr:hypoxanthine-guanine phosphoribosyltransferase [Trypanosoma rangeli]RNF00093.1 hypoxanthine-guanine phosphoribosyltransferase [Trypanosoma rangeli]|eukprot:RNF00093.1 hypoxanthine-guanine phosphoribosyltransferase [Trypanosoma rangeli]